MIDKHDKSSKLSKFLIKKSPFALSTKGSINSESKLKQKIIDTHKKDEQIENEKSSTYSKKVKSASKASQKRPNINKNGVKVTKSLLKKDKTAVKKKNIKPEKDTLTRRERRSLKIDAKKNPETVRYLLSKWEILRRDDTDKEKKFELVDQMLKNSNKSLSEFCFAHDTSRIIESMIQFGNERQKYEIFVYLKPKLMEMSESHFGRFVVKKLITYCAKDQISEFIKLVSGNVAKLLVHKYSCEIVELLFNDHANAKQRSQMLQELYGNRDLLGLNDVKSSITLEDVINQNSDKRQAILSNVNSVLVKLVSKNLTSMSIIQRLILEYLTCEVPFLRSMLPANKNGISTERSADFKLPERLQTLLDAFIEHSQLVPMLHTREGVRVALCLLWVSGSKTKKGLLKSLKTAVSSIATNENGYLFVIGLLDFVDDVVLLEKTVIKELMEDLEIIVTHPYGRKVLLYALTPRNTLHFSKQLMQSLFFPGDLSPFTKKPLGLRAFELRSFSVGLLPALLRLAIEKLVTLFVGDRVEHFKPILDRGRLILLTEIIIQSSSKALTSQYCLKTFSRSVDFAHENINLSELTTVEMDSMTQMRKQVLADFVKLCLCPEFLPTGKSLPKSSADKETNQQKRRKKALALAEEESIKRRKITVPAFSKMEEKKSIRLDDEEGEEEPMDVDDEKKDNINNVELTQEDEILLEMPWLERPEATPILNKLIEDCKSSQCFDLCDLIMEKVNPAVLRSWINCNRTCFFLVKLLELDYKPMFEFITKTVSNRKFIDSLKDSKLKAGEILFKKLN